MDENMYMQYRKDSKGNDLSILGYGCMRFTKKGYIIDFDKAEKEIMEAVNCGVNYFDTAYIYPGCEVTLGKVLKKNKCRDKVYIATKLPLFMVRSKESFDKLFNEQLNRLQTECIDYYLMHMLNDLSTWKRLQKLGIEDWIQSKIESGQIRYIGFSFHGNSEAFKELVDIYKWDFCQIQYNYIDEFSQAGKTGLLYAHNKGLPVIIMEPLRGGRLVNLLPNSAKRLIEKEGNGRSAAEWAFRWLYNQCEVTTVLSGMNSMEMVKENIRVACEAKAGYFTKEDFDLIEKIKVEINNKIKVGCTGCGYCIPCPRGVDIPNSFRCYNLIYSENKRSGKWEYLQVTALRNEQSSASQCVGCKKCEQHCPQHIEISKELKYASKELEGIIYKIAKKVVRLGKFY